MIEDSQIFSQETYLSVDILENIYSFVIMDFVYKGQIHISIIIDCD